MDTIEFLGGKYQSGEQILPGVIQTYRALEVSTGRPVYVHRIASSDDPNQQLILFRLLSAALVRSPAVRSMILDIRDQAGEWFVVTGTSPQCLLLREWLQFELDNAAKPAEADRISADNSNADWREKEKLSPTPEATPAKSSDEPGEFTRFFKGGVPAAVPLKPAGGERPSRTGFVQRPNTPMPHVPAITPRKDEPGEFTKMFNKPLGESTPASLPGAQQSARDFDNLFGPKVEVGMPVPVAPNGPGEYTRIFGSNSVPPPVQPPSALGERARTDFDDPLAIAGTSSRPSAPTANAVAPAGPSEYTRIISGNRVAGTTSEVSAGGGATPSAAPPLPGLVLPPTPQLPPAPHVPPIPGASVPQIPGVATPHLPTSPVSPQVMAVPAASAPANKKLILFFAVLGVLALLLVLMVLLVLRK